MAVTCFNSRAPRGARHGVRRWIDEALLFQFTRPAWGATVRHADCVARTCVSIHAPRVGRDAK